MLTIPNLDHPFERFLDLQPYNFKNFQEITAACLRQNH
jgi:hypothetical protein